MHPGSLAKILPKIRPGGFALANSTLCPKTLGRHDRVVVEVPASRIAEEAGRIQIPGKDGE